MTCCVGKECQQPQESWPSLNIKEKHGKKIKRNVNGSLQLKIFCTKVKSIYNMKRQNNFKNLL